MLRGTQSCRILGLSVLSLFFLALAAMTAAAQVSPVEELAQSTAASIAKNPAQWVLIAPLGGCLIYQQPCPEFESNLRVALQGVIPDVQFVPREEAVREIKSMGLLAVDAYQESVVELGASSVGARILVTVNLLWSKAGYQLSSKAIDTGSHKELGQFKSKELLPLPDLRREPYVFRDPDSGMALIIPRDPTRFTQGPHPECRHCPEPTYTEEMRATGQEGKVILLATITDQGLPADLYVLQTFSTRVTAATLKTVQGWRFKPAVGSDGKPFATRTVIEVTFKLLR